MVACPGSTAQRRHRNAFRAVAAIGAPTRIALPTVDGWNEVGSGMGRGPPPHRGGDPKIGSGSHWLPVGALGAHLRCIRIAASGLFRLAGHHCSRRHGVQAAKLGSQFRTTGGLHTFPLHLFVNAIDLTRSRRFTVGCRLLGCLSSEKRNTARLGPDSTVERYRTDPRLIEA